MTVPTLTELKDSLILQPYHSCCEDASYLYPPTRGITDGEFVWMQGNMSVMKSQITARDEWIFDIGDGGYAPVIKFCPFCGEELVVEVTEAELRQWWQTLGLTLQRQSIVRLDVLGISLGKVRSSVERSLRERPGWERWELFIEAVFEVGEDAFVKMMRTSHGE